MNLSEQQLLLIEKYLSSDLTPEEKMAFDTELKNDAFKDQLLFQAKLVDSYKEIEDQKFKDQYLNSPQQSIKPISIFPLLIKLAAAVVLIFGVLYFMKSIGNTEGLSSEQLYTEFYTPYPPEKIQRGNDTTMPVDYLNAMQLYAEKDYAKAMEAFTNVEPQSEKTQLYKAICLLETDRLTESKTLLNSLSTSSDISIQQNAEWYAILLDVKVEDGNVKSRISDIANSSNHLFKKEASKLLQNY